VIGAMQEGTMKLQRHIGSGVYVYDEGTDVVLCTLDGNREATNTIVLDRYAMQEFVEWLGELANVLVEREDRRRRHDRATRARPGRSVHR
jgi:hypothetical protein